MVLTMKNSTDFVYRDLLNIEMSPYKKILYKTGFRRVDVSSRKLVGYT